MSLSPRSMQIGTVTMHGERFWKFKGEDWASELDEGKIGECDGRRRKADLIDHFDKTKIQIDRFRRLGRGVSPSDRYTEHNERRCLRLQSQ